MQIVILAGGLGTRLRPLTNDLPKPMVEIAGRPFLDYQIRFLKKNGFEDFVLCVGYRAEKIKAYFEDGSRLRISIKYSFDGKNPLGPAGALKRASEFLFEEFLVTYADSFLRIDYPAFIESFHSSGKMGSMAVLKNRNEFGRSDVEVKGGLIIRYDKSGSSPEMQWINYGATLLAKKSLDLIPDSAIATEEQFYGKLIERKELGAFPIYERFYEIGTISGLREFERFVSENPKLFED